MCGRRFDSFIDPLEASTIRDQLAELLVGERNHVECEFRCCRPDGVDHWVTNMLTPVYGSSGRPDYLVSQIFDFSNPRTREARAYRLVNETPVLLWLTDRQGSPRIGNRTCFEFVGISPEEEDLRTALVERMHHDDMVEVGEGIRQAVSRAGAVRVHRRGCSGPTASTGGCTTARCRSSMRRATSRGTPAPAST